MSEACLSISIKHKASADIEEAELAIPAECGNEFELWILKSNSFKNGSIDFILSINFTILSLNFGFSFPSNKKSMFGSAFSIAFGWNATEVSE